MPFSHQTPGPRPGHAGSAANPAPECQTAPASAAAASGPAPAHSGLSPSHDGPMTPMQLLRQRLEDQGIGTTPIPGGFRSTCPNHLGDRENFEAIEVDERRSLASGGRMPVGAVLIYCHAYGGPPGAGGCTNAALLEALGLEFRDLYPRGGARRIARRQLLTPAAPAVGPTRPELDAETLEQLAQDARSYAEALTPELLQELAKLLGLPVSALQRFGVGWRPYDERPVPYGTAVGSCWTIPEHDGRGRIVGISRRYRNGEKRHLPGGRRGLILAEGWRELPGPIYVPEGFSDTAALVAAGYCAVGRPSATGGLDELAELLATEDRPIVILGENDKHPADDDRKARWPGREGAEQICSGLAERLGRSDIKVMLPPDNHKDIRAFLAAEAREGHRSWQPRTPRQSPARRRHRRGREPDSPPPVPRSPPTCGRDSCPSRSSRPTRSSSGRRWSGSG